MGKSTSTEKIEEVSNHLKQFSEVCQNYAEAVEDNTSEIISLKEEVRRQRRADEKNTEFLQSLVKDFLIGQKDEKKHKWDMAKAVLNWALKIGAVIILAILGVKSVLPD